MELMKMAAGPGTIMEGMWLQAESLDQKLKIPGRGANRYDRIQPNIEYPYESSELHTRICFGWNLYVILSESISENTEIL